MTASYCSVSQVSNLHVLLKSSKANLAKARRTCPISVRMIEVLPCRCSEGACSRRMETESVCLTEENHLAREIFGHPTGT